MIILKGPAIHRDQKRVTVQAPEQFSETSQEVCDRFRAISGWELSLAESARPVPAAVAFAPAGRRMKIKTAYSLIKSVLEGSTLYRTSLKGEESVRMHALNPKSGLFYGMGWKTRSGFDRTQFKIEEIRNTPQRLILKKSIWMSCKI